MMVSSHARRRLNERLPREEAEQVIDRLERAPGSPGLIAVVVARLTGARGDARPEVELRASNGDTIVAIVKDGEVTTAYLRRSSNQSITASALDVDRVESWA